MKGFRNHRSGFSADSGQRGKMIVNSIRARGPNPKVLRFGLRQSVWKSVYEFFS